MIKRGTFQVSSNNPAYPAVITDDGFEATVAPLATVPEVPISVTYTVTGGGSLRSSVVLSIN